MLFYKILEITNCFERVISKNKVKRRVEEMQKYLLKEKLLHDIITVNTERKFGNTDTGNADGGKDDYQ